MSKVGNLLGMISNINSIDRVKNSILRHLTTKRSVSQVLDYSLLSTIVRSFIIITSNGMNTSPSETSNVILLQVRNSISANLLHFLQQLQSIESVLSNRFHHPCMISSLSNTINMETIIRTVITLFHASLVEVQSNYRCSSVHFIINIDMTERSFSVFCISESYSNVS